MLNEAGTETCRLPMRGLDKPRSSINQQSAIKNQQSLCVGAIVNGKERRHPLSQKIDSMHAKCGTADNCRETVINNSGNAEGRPESGSHGRWTDRRHGGGAADVNGSRDGS